MQHSNKLTGSSVSAKGKNLLIRATGKFYTHPFIVQQLAHTLVRSLYFNGRKEFKVVDPFCGDARLLVGLIEQATSLVDCANIKWTISAWDCDKVAVVGVRAVLHDLVKRLHLKATLDIQCRDTLLSTKEVFGTYDCVITNPPWEALKPDRREMEHMAREDRESYVAGIHKYDNLLAGALPFSQPDRKFAGWGTNLSRCGLELSLRLLKNDAYCGIVLPASVLTDQTSVGLRKWIFEKATLTTVAHYPAEARLFKGVDQACVSAVFKNTVATSYSTTIVRYGKDLLVVSKDDFPLTKRNLESLDYGVPLESGRTLLKFIKRWGKLPRFCDLEGREPGELWAGRELDETNHTRFLTNKGRVMFLKGRMVDRFRVAIKPTQFINESIQSIPESALHPRLAWRDVARRSQGRRMQVTFVEPAVVTGNSLSVAYFRDDNSSRLKALIAVMNSFPFEFQVRARSATGHISLGLVRKAFIPDLANVQLVKKLAALVDGAKTNRLKESSIEVYVARAYGLSKQDYEELLQHFPGLPVDYKRKLLESQIWDELNNSALPLRRLNRPAKIYLPAAARIPNHYTSKLSVNDMRMAVAIPPGGNWKNIPLSVESQRLENIRKSYAAGEGSRSTYYGRLRANLPAYTINTYFNRPGNGCHLHYDYEGGQHRVLSEREAARIQSFPDSFTFCGSHCAILKQIGNAVPPLLGYQIAKTLPKKGYFVDLFCGAGGLSLGFKWAGWKPLIGNDIESPFLDTYRHNVHNQAICGDIRDSQVFSAIVSHVKNSRFDRSVPLFVLGGPPCQGFSTAGKRRSMEDDRNQLFYEYKRMLQALGVDGFVFENVTGLLNMDGGAVFELVKSELSSCAKNLVAWKMQAENYGIPQRRTRIVLVGHSFTGTVLAPPTPITSMSSEPTLFGRLPGAVSVKEAIGDLPSLKPGEDGSQTQYLSKPQTPYQALMRGEMTPAEYLKHLRSDAALKVDALAANVAV